MYENNNEVLAGAFPQLFLFGKTYSHLLKRPLTQEQKIHLLCQYTNLPGRTKELYFLIYSQHICHSNATSVAAKVSENPETFNELCDKVVTKEFRTDIEFAMKHPKSKLAKSIIAEVSPILVFQEQSNLYTPFDQEKMQGKMLSMARRYGGVSCFVTIAPDSIANPNILRMSLQHVANSTFPAECDERFLESIINNSTYVTTETATVNCDYKSRAQSIIDNPLPSVLEYISLIYNVFVELLGLTPSNRFATLNVNPHFLLCLEQRQAQ